MSLFERLNNKRYNLQEKKEFPGDKSGAYQRAKSDLETRKGFSKNKSGGLKADEKNPYVKRSVRKTRVDKLGGDIYDQPKFSQKGFDKSLKNISKGSKTNIADPFGTGDTPGQQKVKAMDAKAFKVTQPSDIKKSKGFKPFAQLSQEIKKEKNRRLSAKTTRGDAFSRATGTSGSTEGAGGASGSQNKGVNQADVSKKIAKDNEVYNQTRKASGYSQTNKPKSGSQVTVSKGVNPEVVGKTPFDTKSGGKSKGTRTVNTSVPQKGQEYKPRKIVKTRANIFNINKIKNATGTGKTPELPKFLDLKTGNIKKSFRKGDIDYSKLSSANKSFARTSSALVKKTPKALQKVVSGVAKTGLKLGRGGRLGLLGGTVATIASPAGRRLIRNALGFSGLAYFGNKALKKPKSLKVGDGITKVSNMPSKYQPKGMKSGTFKEPGSNKVRGTGDVRVRYGLTGSKKNKDGTVTPGGRIVNPTDMSRVKNIQKKYIDSYNASVKGNPLKKQIKYNVNKDGSYTVTPPKKK